jgi:hypothetical protein
VYIKMNGVVIIVQQEVLVDEQQHGVSYDA